MRNAHQQNAAWLLAACLIPLTACPVPPNQAPNAEPGPSRYVLGGVTVSLDGSSSSDPDGSIVAWEWRQTGGPAVALADATSPVASFDSLPVMVDTPHGFELTVTDDQGSSNVASVTITVLDPPGPPGLDARPANATCLAPARPVPDASIQLTQPYPGLATAADPLVQPLGLLQAPGDDTKWYVVEQPGRVRVFDNDPAVAAIGEFVDIRGPVDDGPNEAGLLGMAFHPDYASNGEVFLSYTADGSPLVSTLSRFHLDTGTGKLDPASEEIILTIDQDSGNHNGGHIAFGPDGFLYLGLGDGGGGGDPNNRAQRPQFLLGSMLRIDVDVPFTNDPPYAIPSDNPFAANPTCRPTGTGALPCPEVYAWGLRNPWRWSFDPETEALWLGDVGQGSWEEVDRIELGGNYGWNIREGAHCYPPGSSCSAGGLIDPVAEYQSIGAFGNSITGGYVYRGQNVPDLVGRYVFGDFSSGRIWALIPDEQGALARQLLLENTGVNIASFGVDADDELYVVGLISGRIYRIDPSGGGGTDDVAVNLTDSGCVNPSNPKEPAAGLIPFAPNAPFWSDGADKLRWMAIPDGTKVTLDPSGDLVFPIGSVLMKHFVIGGTYVETRLYMRHPDGEWGGYSYEWNGAQNEAVRVFGGKQTEAAGQEWIFPSSGDCGQCHTAAAGRTLGPEVAQLNGDLLYPATGRTANQLATLAAIGLFDPPLGDLPENLPALTPPSDTGADDGPRARAWLHSNCAPCHRPSGPTPSSMDLRHDTPLANAGICDVAPLGGDFGIAGARLLFPGDPARSILPERAGRRDASGMPPLGSLVGDLAGIAVLDAWIQGLGSCP